MSVSKTIFRDYVDEVFVSKTSFCDNDGGMLADLCGTPGGTVLAACMGARKVGQALVGEGEDTSFARHAQALWEG